MDDRITVGRLSESILRALLYYDLFDHPLTSEEVFRNLPTNHVSPHDVNDQLAALVNQAVVFKFGKYYSLQSNPTLEARRINGGKLAARHLVIAVRKAGLIARFPFVRSVMISGSLSKGYADDKSDIDFFIVTTAGRLWITRTLLALYRRVFLLYSHKYFCVNYLIDEEHLEIEEKNRFTATELTTLIPMYGIHHYRQLMEKNSWILDFFPNFRLKEGADVKNNRPAVRMVIEWVLNRCWPDQLDQFLLRLALRRWIRVYRPSLEPTEFELAFKSKRYVSKGHPKAHQNKVLTRFEERAQAFAKCSLVNDAP